MNISKNGGLFLKSRVDYLSEPVGNKQGQEQLPVILYGQYRKFLEKPFNLDPSFEGVDKPVFGTVFKTESGAGIAAGNESRFPNAGEK
jgi:hypothetical protein